METNLLVRKLASGGPLGPEDIKRLNQIVRDPIALGARQDIIRQGEDPENVHLILDGIACRYKVLPDGGRSIMALLIPGDFCDLDIAILPVMDHSIGTLTPCTMVDIPRKQIMELLNHHPRIARALRWATLVDEAVLREWLVNMGQRRADRQMAHLFCELFMRFRAVGLADPFLLPLTQEQLADTLGITPVHAQRVLASLRSRNMIALESRAVTIIDFDRLMAFAEFNPDYLHLVSPK
ncbi:Crp/Fnr family transcriptional regulator [Paracoccus sp. S1E-3]|uniref:Crp/Fnr family transcriptional regulator n=1 Tax=Paracoccus sp. S1E-3 TaxID=2756130 RepID=UPI0015EEDCB2|nr:Crp/Fnr family transcriptional regulator [Paracoccus sp. S1E-3]MBA4491670.1 Crp/Fnr family transcriptional regulator [Paracoccus sp. S1E-3]